MTTHTGGEMDKLGDLSAKWRAEAAFFDDRDHYKRAMLDCINELDALRAQLAGGGDALLRSVVREHIDDLRRMAVVFNTYEGFAGTAGQCLQAASELSEALAPTKETES